MIKLTKGTIPEILATNAARWTEELLASIANGEDAKAAKLARYQNKEIKEALKKETSDKCAYCESKPLAVAFGDIEHVEPKSQNPSLAFDWTNLTLACGRCNTNKGEHEGVVDPYSDEPNDEFLFEGPMIFHKTSREKAERTIAWLDLNRIELLERRGVQLKRIRELIDRLAATSDAEHKEFLLNEILNAETEGGKEYAACIRTFVSAMRAEAQL